MKINQCKYGCNPSEAKALNDIKTHGFHMLAVHDNGQPAFVYSIGIQETLNRPECIVVGLRPEVAAAIIGNYYNRAKAGETFEVGKRYSDFIAGFEMQVEEVHPSHFKDYVGWALGLYGKKPFKVIQLVYPTTQGAWPWEIAPSDCFRKIQPRLTVPVAR
jgi:hypothetical protein